MKMEGGPVPPNGEGGRGQSGNVLGQTGGTDHVLAERNQGSLNSLGDNAPQVEASRCFPLFLLTPQDKGRAKR